jgi:energy-coupling factor transporter ATP-binding protein EcfA2
MKAAITTNGNSIRAKAMRLVRDPFFLYRLGEKVGELGVVGEKRNRLVLGLAGIGRTVTPNVSVLVKGSTSSGKSTLIEVAAMLFPPDCVVKRASLSPKALAHGKATLAGKIFVLREFRGGKDALLLLRLLQSEGQIEHEFTSVRGSERSTETAKRVGKPVIFTTTTEANVFEDDETRFLSIWADESPDQSLAIMIAKASGVRLVDNRDLPVWRKALSLPVCKKGDFEDPPAFLRYVAAQLPLGRVRVRRDWDRCLSFFKSIALCRGDWQPKRSVNITFADYCVGYLILESVFASTLRGVHPQELTLVKAVAKLNKTLERAVTTKEIAGELEWREPVVYKYVTSAVRSGLLRHEEGTREKNVKPIIACREDSGRFLPGPRSVLRNNPEIGSPVKYVDPFTGTWKTLEVSGAKVAK